MERHTESAVEQSFGLEVVAGPARVVAFVVAALVVVAALRVVEGLVVVDAEQEHFCVVP
jgi:hypothetical protein